MKNFLNSVWFNIIIAVLAGFFGVMQEVWIGSDVPGINIFALGALAACGMSWGASVINFVITRGRFNWKNIGIGAAVGVVVALVTMLIAC
jgi:hypothetical protein